MPTRFQQTTLPQLNEQAVFVLLTGRQWYFIADPVVFVDQAAMLACYRRIRHILKPWAAEHLRGAIPWGESLLTGELVPTITAEHHGFSMQSLRDFLTHYYGGA
jgi:hypothetical protein